MAIPIRDHSRNPEAGYTRMLVSSRLRSKVLVVPGIYETGVTIDKPNIIIEGLVEGSEVVQVNAPIVVKADQVELRHLTIRCPPREPLESDRKSHEAWPAAASGRCCLRGSWSAFGRLLAALGWLVGPLGRFLAASWTLSGATWLISAAFSGATWLISDASWKHFTSPRRSGL